MSSSWRTGLVAGICAGVRLCKCDFVADLVTGNGCCHMSLVLSSKRSNVRPICHTRKLRLSCLRNCGHPVNSLHRFVLRVGGSVRRGGDQCQPKSKLPLQHSTGADIADMTVAVPYGSPTTLTDEQHRILKQVESTFLYMAADPVECDGLTHWLSWQANEILKRVGPQDFTPSEMVALVGLLGPVFSRVLSGSVAKPAKGWSGLRSV